MGKKRNICLKSIRRNRHETIANIQLFYVRVDYPSIVDLQQKRILRIASFIESWFKKSARVFPWREESTPWGRLVSEFMAQQTQIERVAQRWPLMMRRFPTPDKMAQSDEQEVLSLWQGLGYYRRARYLKRASEVIVKDFGGRVPSDAELLLKLPGVGRYTAGAVASLAFDKRVPIVDGNVHRVLCRLENKSDTPAPCSWSWDFATQLVQGCTKPNILNEGLMELGATICTPRNPSCDSCPLSGDCKAFSAKTQSTVPPPRSTPKRKRLHHYAVVLTCKGKIAFEKRNDQGLWAGMWQVPTFESTKKVKKIQVAKELQINGELSYSGTFEHTLTHRIIAFSVFRCEVGEVDRYTWYESQALERIPLATAQRKVLAVHCSA